MRKWHRRALLFLLYGQRSHSGGRWACTALALKFLLPVALRLLWDKLRFLCGMYPPPPQIWMEGHMMHSQGVLKYWEQKVLHVGLICLHSGKDGIWWKHPSRDRELLTVALPASLVLCSYTHFCFAILIHNSWSWMGRMKDQRFCSYKLCSSKMNMKLQKQSTCPWPSALR